MRIIGYHGVIYRAPSAGKRLVYGLVRVFSAGLIAFAVTGLIFSFTPIIDEEIKFRFGKKETTGISGFGKILAESDASEARSLGLDPYFSIYIPKIAAKAKVIPNVNAGIQKEYLAALQEGVAHAAGTNFPGQGKNIFLFSHSTDSPLNFARFNAVFYLLGKLKVEDRITLYFLDKKFAYEIEQKLITEANDTSWLANQNRGEVLILQTCYPPGTTLKRLILLAKPV